MTIQMQPNKNITMDLSLIFDKTGYIKKKNREKYRHNEIVENIILTQSIDSPIKIGNKFLYHYNNLISVDTSQLINVFAIGDCFLARCVKLTVFDTTGLVSLKTIGHLFLCGCEKLTVFDTTGLVSLKTIGSLFLSFCQNLTNFDAKGLISLIAVEEDFLVACNSNLIITIKNPSDYLREILSETNYEIVQLYEKITVYLVNSCVI